MESLLLLLKTLCFDMEVAHQGFKSSRLLKVPNLALEVFSVLKSVQFDVEMVYDAL